MWEFVGERHTFYLANPKFGGFPPSHHRHKMAVRVTNDKVQYEAARADTSTVIKQTTDNLKQQFRRFFVDRINDTLLQEMSTRRIEKHLRSFQKWSAMVWRRARHDLLGGICTEIYRAGVAQLVFNLMGRGGKLAWGKQKLADVKGGKVGCTEVYRSYHT